MSTAFWADDEGCRPWGNVARPANTPWARARPQTARRKATVDGQMTRA